MNKIHVLTPTELTQLTSYLNQLTNGDLLKLEGFAKFLCWRSPRYQSNVRTRYCPADFVLHALTSIIPNSSGETIRKPRPIDLQSFDRFLSFLRGVIASLTFHALNNSEDNHPHESLDIIDENNGQAALTMSPNHQMIENLILLLRQAIGNDSERRALARFIKVLDGGARPAHRDYMQLSEEAKGILRELILKSCSDSMSDDLEVRLEIPCADGVPLPRRKSEEKIPVFPANYK